MDKKSHPLFSQEEEIRYSRHFVLPSFGTDAQQKLKNSRVLVVGAGGLGSPVLLYLTAAGVGNILIADDDTVSVSNLQRQVIYTTKDISTSKAKTAAEKCISLNPNVAVKTMGRVTSENILPVLKHIDLVVDCTDNFPTRYLLNDACILANIPFIYGSIFRYEGQVAVFNYKGGPNYRDLYAIPPAPEAVPSCEEGGVLGVLPGIVGSIQANEALKILGGFGEPLSGKLLIIDSYSMEITRLNISDQNTREKIKSLINYDEFCEGTTNKTPIMKEVTVQELKELIDNKADFQLIDVREPHEFDICNLSGELIPQGDIPASVDKISKDKQVVIHCRSGARSGNMVQWLEKNHGFTNLYNLKGGILGWAKEIDTSMPTY